jgi:hypothetical protein
VKGGLRHLDLTDSNVRDEHLFQLSSPTLETLVVYQTGLTLEGLLRMGPLPALHALPAISTRPRLFSYQNTSPAGTST